MLVAVRCCVWAIARCCCWSWWWWRRRFCIGCFFVLFVVVARWVERSGSRRSKVRGDDMRLACCCDCCDEEVGGATSGTLACFPSRWLLMGMLVGVQLLDQRGQESRGNSVGQLLTPTDRRDAAHCDARHDAPGALPASSRWLCGGEGGEVLPPHFHSPTRSAPAASP